MNRQALKEINQIEVPPTITNMSAKSGALGRTRSGTAALKRQASSQEHSSAKRLKTDNNPTSDSDSEPNSEPDISSFINYIIQVLGSHYSDVSGRLNLNSIPDCITNQAACSQDHSGKIFAEFDEFLMREVAAFVMDGKVEVFYEQLSLIVMKGEFPGDTLLKLMFETMLAFNESHHESILDNLLETGETIFVQALQKFPPCWSKMRNRYLNLMIEPLQLDTFKKHKEFDSNKGLFNLLIFMLEHNLRHEDPPVKKRQDQSVFVDSVDMNFAIWEEHTKQNYDFTKNGREDKIERAFRVLRLLVQLLEQDLAVWMLKNPQDMQKKFGSSDKKPLVASLLWPDQYCSVNFEVKRIMKVFIECVHLNYPSEGVEVLSRLLNVIATCINISETRTTTGKNKTVQFPSINNNTELFAKEMKRLIDDFQHFSVSLYAKVLKNLHTPCIKAVLARLMLTRINQSKGPPKPGRDTPLHFLMSSLNNRDWRKMSAGDTNLNPSSNHEKYPVMPKKTPRKKAAFVVTQEDFLFIQLAELKSHMNIYRIHELYNTLKETPLTSANNDFKSVGPFFTKFDIKMLEQLSKTLPKYKFQFETVLPKNESPQTVFKSINIDQSLIMNYREQMKLCYHLQRFFDKAVVKYPELKDFQSYLNATLQK